MYVHDRLQRFFCRTLAKFVNVSALRTLLRRSFLKSRGYELKKDWNLVASLGMDQYLSTC